jgi:hypothetical protein
VHTDARTAPRTLVAAIAPLIDEVGGRGDTTRRNE